jgi:hypothetical protein
LLDELSSREIVTSSIKANRILLAQFTSSGIFAAVALHFAVSSQKLSLPLNNAVSFAHTSQKDAAALAHANQPYPDKSILTSI